MNMPLTLSVLMSNFNHSRYLPEALRAVLEQSFQPLEIIIIDDASKDDSARIIREFAARNPLIRFIQNPRNQGTTVNGNRLLEMARGDYIYGPACDDRIAPGLFERAMASAARHPQAGIVFGKYQAMDPNGKIIEGGELGVRLWQQEIFADPQTFLKECLDVELATHSLACAAVFKREALLEVGGFRPELGSWSDTFAMRAIALKHGACYIPQVLMHWRLLPGSLAHSARRDPRHLLDIGARAAWLMRSPEFKERFPEGHVARWERDYRAMVIRDYRDSLGLFPRPRRKRIRAAISRWGRAGERLGKLFDDFLAGWYRFKFRGMERELSAYGGDISCYSGARHREE
ncbi:MAG: glycosyltransferase family 2 protein [Elusimicrobia bacterium]|nr:glycosyltransferase family 2 protein [Elusimicrobiota bacterium]